jgi:hypothetical protein
VDRGTKKRKRVKTVFEQKLTGTNEQEMVDAKKVNYRHQSYLQHVQNANGFSTKSFRQQFKTERSPQICSSRVTCREVGSFSAIAYVVITTTCASKWMTVSHL